MSLRREALHLFDYQQLLHDEARRRFDAGDRVVCVAAAPGGGKTQIAISIIQHYIRAGTRALVLTHGTTILRSNFVERLCRYGVPHDVCQPGRPGSLGRLVVSLPQTVARKDIGAFDLVVIDEAHERYGKEQSASILDRVQAKRVLLLTGTPSKFIERQIPIVAASPAELFDIGRLSDPIIEIAKSDYRLSYGRDYNADGDVKDVVRYRKRDTNATLERVVQGLTERLGERGIRSLKKTLVACRSIEQAIQVQKFFTAKKIGALLSHSDEDRAGFDEGSENFAAFKKDPAVKVLVVVQRGILGFDMPELTNVVDMTGSLNPNRIFQLLSRGVRKSEHGGRKLFVKLAAETLLPYTTSIMSVVMQLAASENFYKTWDGSLPPGMPVLMREPSGAPRARGDGGGGPARPRAKRDLDGSLEFDGWIPMVRKHELYEGHVWSTLGKARRVLLGSGGHHFQWTDEAAQRLGTCPDEALAADFGISRMAVKVARNLRGISAFGLKIVNWDHEPDLGRVPDRVLGERHGVHLQTVAKARRDRGIEPSSLNGKRTDLSWRLRLGRESDSEIARAVGLSSSTVTLTRQRLGITAFHRMRNYDHVNWSQQPLGIDSDAEIGGRLGVPPHAVRQERKRRGIPGSTNFLDWSDPRLKRRLGTLPDAKLAVELGVCSAAVTNARRRRGIPSYRSGRATSSPGSRSRLPRG